MTVVYKCKKPAGPEGICHHPMIGKNRYGRYKRCPNAVQVRPGLTRCGLVTNLDHWILPE